MTPFEYLSVLLSIILGLAIAQILHGYRGLLLARARVQPHWPPLIWSGAVLLFATQSWWASFGLEGRASWSFAAFAIILLQMALVYMLAALILPDIDPGEPIDLAAHYDAERVPFFGCLLAVVVVSLIKDVMLDGVLPEPTNLIFHALLAATALAGLLLRGPRAQLALAIAAPLIFIAYVTLLFARL